MIIANGTMQAVLTTGEGFDEYGNPVVAERILSASIPVNISGRRRRENLTSNDNSYISASYEVLCDDTTFDAQEIELKNNRGKSLGAFRVLDIQYLDCVDAVKLYVERYGE